MSFKKYVAIIGLIATIPVYKGWFFKLLLWNKSRKLLSLEKQLEIINKLKNDSNYLVIFIGQSILAVLTIVACAQFFEIMSLSSSNDMSSVFISITSIIAYFFAINRLGILTKAKKYEKYSEILNAEIAKLKA